jgi:hypothetical protein
MLKLATTLLALSCTYQLFSAETSQAPTQTPTQELFLPSSRPEVAKGSGLFILADWLYWQANETGLSFAVDNPDFDITNDTIMGSGETVQPKFDWHSGVRLGIGYNLPHDGWDSKFIWTWYEGMADNSVRSSGDSPTIFGTFIHPNVYSGEAIAAALSADANLFLHLNLLDLELGKQIGLSKSFSLRPYVGLRTGWLNQNYTIQYQNLFNKVADLVLDEYNTSIKNDYWGIGILGGLGSDWGIKWGLSLFGDFAVSLLYGFFDTGYTESYITPTGAGGVTISDTNSFRAGRAIADLQLGLRWVGTCLKDRIKLMIQAGWEHHMFFSQNQILRFTDGQNWGSFVQNQGDVDFQGWFAGFGIYF